MLFWTPGAPGPKNNTCSRKEGFVGLAAKCGKENNLFVSEKLRFVGFGTPGLQKNTWPKKQVRDPFDILVVVLRVKAAT